MESSNYSIIQLLPPLVVMVLIVMACYLFYQRYVVPSRDLVINLQKIGSTVRSMIDGDEAARRAGVARVFVNTPLETVWRDFAKTLHMQTAVVNGVVKQKRSRITIPASHFFSVNAVIDRPLGVDYFKHLPGILTGVGIIGTFSGLLFGLSNFDSTSTEAMQKSVALLLAGVRDAFYASAAAITAAMVITHFEKSLYRRCVAALDELVDSVNSAFEAGVGEEYLSQLVQNSASASDQARLMKDELIQAMVPVIKQMETIQVQQAEGLGAVLEQAFNESNKRLAAQLETALQRQIKAPLEELARRMDGRGAMTPSKPDIAQRIIRARQSEALAVNGSEDV